MVCSSAVQMCRYAPNNINVTLNKLIVAQIASSVLSMSNRSN